MNITIKNVRIDSQTEMSYMLDTMLRAWHQLQ